MLINPAKTLTHRIKSAHVQKSQEKVSYLQRAPILLERERTTNRNSLLLLFYKQSPCPLPSAKKTLENITAILGQNPGYENQNVKEQGSGKQNGVISC